MKAYNLTNYGPLTLHQTREWDEGEIYPLDDYFEDDSFFTKLISDSFNQAAKRALREYLGDPSLTQEFRWVPRKGDSIRPKDMSTQHLFYALRMMFNNVVAPVFRIDPDNFIRYSDIRGWPLPYLQRASMELLKEIDRRGDLESPLKEQLDDLILNAELLERLYT